MSKFLTFLFGLVLGGLAGYLAGVLSAPQSGEDTRQELSGRAIELRERAGETASRVRDGVLGSLNSTVNLGEDFTR